MFSGFRSRCTMPRACAAPSPRATWRATSSAASTDSGAGAEPRAQRLAFQALRHEVRGAAVIPDVVDGQHVGVIEGAGGARLVLERAHSFRGVRRMREEQLDRHVAPESLVARPPHLAHPACSQPSLDGVGGDAIAGLDAPPLAGDLPREDIERRRGEKVARLLRGGQQRRDLVPHAGIGAARAGEEVRAQAGGLLHGLREDLVRGAASGQWAWAPSAFGTATPARTPSPRERCGPILRAPRRSPRSRGRRRSEAPRPGPCVGPPGRASGAPMSTASTSAPGSLAGTSIASRGTRIAFGPPRRSARRRRAMSTSTRRIIWAETPKKCPRFCQWTGSQPSRRRHSSLTSAVA